jgi:hypothetical protein
MLAEVGVFIDILMEAEELRAANGDMDGEFGVRLIRCASGLL